MYGSEKVKVYIRPCLLLLFVPEPSACVFSHLYLCGFALCQSLLAFSVWRTDVVKNNSSRFVQGPDAGSALVQRC